MILSQSKAGARWVYLDLEITVPDQVFRVTIIVPEDKIEASAQAYADQFIRDYEAVTEQGGGADAAN